MLRLKLRDCHIHKTAITKYNPHYMTNSKTTETVNQPTHRTHVKQQTTNTVHNLAQLTHVRQLNYNDIVIG